MTEEGSSEVKAREPGVGLAAARPPVPETVAVMAPHGPQEVPTEALPDQVAPRHHIGRWISGIAVLVILALVVRSLARNPNIEWSSVGEFLTADQILKGLQVTLLLAICSFALASVLGAVCAFGRLSRNPVLRWVCLGYIWIFRSVPAIVQILFWGNIALFVPTISLSIPGGPTLFSVDSNTIFTTFVASLVALTVANGAYMAEIVRSGILSVDKGQQEAARALGLTWWSIQRRITLPQALKVMIPEAGSRYISILKETALVSVIAGGDLLTEAKGISHRNYQVIELLIVAALWYLLVTALFSLAQDYMERRVNNDE